MDLITLYWKEFNSLSLLLFLYVLCRSFPRRPHARLRFLAGGCAVLVCSALVLSGWQTGTGMILPAVLLNLAAKTAVIGLIMLVVWLAFDMAWMDICLAVIISIAAAHLTFSIRVFLINLVPALRTGGGRVVDVLFSTILTLAVAWALGQIFREKRSLVSARFRNRGTLIISAAGLLLSNGIIIYLRAISADSLPEKTELALSLYEILFNLLMLYMLYSLVYRGVLYYERNMLQEIARQRRDQYEFSRSMIDTIDIKSHDLKKQIHYLQQNMREPENEKLVQELDRVVTEYDSIIQTSHPTLSTILTEKSLVCIRENIAFSCIADGTGIGFMDKLDIYTLFANLLDNAIEAVRELPPERRSIALNVSTRNDFISIHEENYYSGQVQLVDGRPRTTKKDRRMHGFGTRSMEVITEKYDGSISFKVDGDRFVTNILIPIP